jgi:hypothetical protein
VNYTFAAMSEGESIWGMSNLHTSALYCIVHKYRRMRSADHCPELIAKYLTDLTAISHVKTKGGEHHSGGAGTGTAT